MANTLRLFLLILFFSGLVHLSACGYKNTPEGVADQFLFRYFIELNQRGALELSTGLALDKLEEEIKLTQNVRMTPSLDLAKHKPFLNYELLRVQKRSDQAAILYYDITIENPGGKKSERKFVLSTTKIQDVWKISNFDTYLK